ncbi:hypothetical protein BOX15_Mlig022388g5 [Macrostomum lignano]|uniref:Leishmanolysin-like peptidase n=2 Tax=Macrostomum lignano TaxID=282301 RepID=A0A267E0V5_9PLAT|nr:hypothetical protein BOX15_Mlig022388g5 [Macrostomum lignano]
MNFAALLLVLRSVEAVADCLHRLPRHSPASGSLCVDDGFKTGGFSAPSLATSIEGPELARRERDVVAIQSATTTTQITEPLRILVHYEPSLAAATDSESVTLRRLVEDSVLYWQSVLSVRHQSSAPPVAFWLPRPCKSNKVRVVRSPVTGAFLHYCADGCSSSAFCGHTSVPAAHLDLCRELTPAQDGGRLQHSGSRGAGVRWPYNYALYVSAYDTVRCGGPDSQTLGYSAHCQLDGLTDRPLAGYINLCRRRSDRGRSTSSSRFLVDPAEAQYTARHELLHALGVTATLFAFMRQDNGVPRTPRNPATNMPALGLIEDDGVTLYQWGNDTVIQTKEPWRSARGVYNLTRHYVVTPRLVSLVRAHFNCPKMPGLPLENQGKLGSALTHWEKRLLESELMTAAYTGSSVVSEFTLAFLEDTGWYSANYSTAQPIAWGRNLGCKFVYNSCYDWMVSHHQSAWPYCNLAPKHTGPRGDAMLRTGCSDDRRSKRYCNLDELSNELPLEYQYFGGDVNIQQAGLSPGGVKLLSSESFTRYGGTSRFADYCPYPQAYTTLSKSTDRNSDCFRIGNQPVKSANPGMELFGSKSVCLIQPEPFQLQFCGRRHAAATYGSGCYPVRCPQQPAARRLSPWLVVENSPVQLVAAKWIFL